MYSRNRSSAEVRYADNVPPVYGGSRFYRGAPSPPPPDIRGEEVRAAVPDGGIPVQYEARTVRPPRELPEDREAQADRIHNDRAETACAEAACVTRDEPRGEEKKCREDPLPSKPCGESESHEKHGKEGRREGLLPALLGDPEEILLIVLLLLLTGEQERSSDMIFILLLLMIVR